MADRKPIPKRVRFEVFKRDRFTCQYCGAKAPDAILEIDHVKPVAEGGGDEMLNLVTACRDCNRGKGKVLLSDESSIAVQRKQMEELEARREQLEMMYEWQMSLVDAVDAEVGAVDALLHEISGSHLTDSGRKTIRSHISKFGVKEVMASLRIALMTYGHDTHEEIERAYAKIGGICYNRANPRCGLCKEKVDEDGDVVECKTYGEMPSDSARICPIYSPWFGGGFR